MELKAGTASSSKRQKFHVSKEAGIGRLPDAMLCHILSFLETKDAIRASVLSKRWRYAWKFVPCIDIHYPRDGQCFIDFLEKMLHLNTVSCLRKLSLTWSINNNQLSEWISTLMERDIEEIVLNVWGHQCMKLPPTIFTSKKLVILRLGSGIILDVPSSVNLPCLKILHLYLGKHFDEDPMNKLLAGCPVIEELNIQDVEVYNLKTLFVRSSSLKSLSISSGSGHLIDFTIVIDVPNVEQLRLDHSDDGNAQYDINNLSSLVNLKVRGRLSRLAELLRELTNTEYIEEIVLDLWGIQYVKLPPTIFTCNNLVILKLCSSIIVDVPSSVNLLSLKILHLYLGNSFDEDSMKKLLDGCPVIEELNIKGVEDGTRKKRKKVQDVNVQTLFVRSSSLKILSIYCSSNGRLSDLRIVVDVPNVERLDLMDKGNAQYDISSLSSLVKLNVNIGQVSRIVELLGKFTNTEYMRISFETMKILEYQTLNDFPMFLNLTHLEVSSHEYSRSVLPSLLESMPNLVTLVSKCVGGKGRALEQPLHHFKAPKCMMLYLEEIELKGFKGFTDEMEMISYFLKNSMVLKKLSIQSGYGSGKRYSEISQELLTFRRSSPKCQIIFK